MKNYEREVIFFCKDVLQIRNRWYPFSYFNGMVVHFARILRLHTLVQHLPCIFLRGQNAHQTTGRLQRRRPQQPRCLCLPESMESS